MGAGGSGDRSWVRAVSAVDGRSRLLLGGDAIGGSPVNGAITPDGRRFLLLVAQPDETAPEQAAVLT